MALSLQPKELQQALVYQAHSILFADVLESEMIETAWLASDSFFLYILPHPLSSIISRCTLMKQKLGCRGAAPIIQQK